ncbi:MAG: PQQ-binding-like beta-propeller repeat protein [Bacteroidales bacterium]|jgi:outer membrane protein assembly factor BamB|nr:PQQ-binding-like beta-propeller repeat protein [Bacteroidales bacterium]
MKQRILILFFLILINTLSAQDWTHWRGPNYNGTSSESLAPDTHFALNDPDWKQIVGVGSGSVIVCKDLVYTTGWQEGEETVYCLNAQNGFIEWEQSYTSPYYGRYAFGDQEFYAGPTATPTLDNSTGLLFTLGCDGDLNCWDTDMNGKLQWSINLYERYKVVMRPNVGGGQRDYGFTTAPLVNGDELLVVVGSEAGLLVALDKKTGKQLWSSENHDFASNCGGISPILVEEIPCIAVLSLEQLVIIRTDPGYEGKTLAEYPWRTDYANNIVTPTIIGNRILLSASYNHRKLLMLEVGSDTIVKKWESKYFSGVCSPVIYNDKIYMSFMQLYCLDLATGSLVWNGGRFGPDGSCLVTGDGYLIVFGNGNLTVVYSAEQSPNSYKELASYQNICPANSAWPNVVLARSRIYCKDKQGNLNCFKLN